MQSDFEQELLDKKIMRRLLSRPSPDYGLLIHSLITGVKFKSDMLFFKRGRDALVYGLKILNIDPKSILLVPAYMCDSTVAPLRDRGYKLVFFDIEEDLSFDFEVLESLMKRLHVSAILAPHYFGFPNDLKGLIDLCKIYDVAVIEDCAHSFLSKIDDEIVGSFGHIAIFSMRKILAVPDGGALKVNFRDLKFKESTYHGGLSVQDLIYLVQRFLEFILVRIFCINIYSEMFKYLRHKMKCLLSFSTNSLDVTKINRPSAPSWSLKAYLSNQDFLEEISLKRYHNFKLLTGLLDDHQAGLVFKKVPVGCVPQFFVIKDESGRLAKKWPTDVVAIHRWPGEELPSEVMTNPERYPVANKLNRTVMLLPLHQNMLPEQLNHLIDVFEK